MVGSVEGLIEKVNLSRDLKVVKKLANPILGGKKVHTNYLPLPRVKNQYSLTATWWLTPSAVSWKGKYTAHMLHLLDIPWVLPSKCYFSGKRALTTSHTDFYKVSHNTRALWHFILNKMLIRENTLIKTGLGTLFKSSAGLNFLEGGKHI